MEAKRPIWSSKISFILAATGSAVGLGNIWRFPYVMGQNGGALFLLIYILIIATICFIPMIVELLVGKTTKKECVGAYESINPKFKTFGIMCPVTGILVSSFYFVVGGWIINYFLKSLINFKCNDYLKYFSDFTQDGVSVCACTLLFLFGCVFFNARGIKKGIEFANQVLMPLFALLLLFLIVVSLNLPNAHLGLEYMFKPDFSKLNSQMFLAALGQAFFTLSIGPGTLLTYGSYIKEDKSIAKTAYTIIIFDTIFALSAGIMIFPAVFSFGLEPNSGPGLVFVTLPEIFSQIPYGEIISVAFFILLLCAAMTSGISMLEIPIATFSERFKMTRKKACGLLFLIIASISIPAGLSFGILSGMTVFHKTIFELLDFTTSNIMMPLNSLILCLIAGWVMKIKGKSFLQNEKLSKLFDVGLKYVVPVVLILLFYMGLK